MPDSKVSLRTKLKAVISSIPRALVVHKSQQLFEQLLQSPEFQRCRSICAYLSLPNEPDTEPVIREALSARRKVFVPQILPDNFRFANNLQGNCSGMSMQRLCYLDQIKHWPLNKWGIREPPLPDKWDHIEDQMVAQGGVELFLVPGLAFTRSGKRLGRGGGYYDRYLEWYRSQCRSLKLPPPKLIALVFEEQLLDEIDTCTHDIVVDRVIFA